MLNLRVLSGFPGKYEGNLNDLVQVFMWYL